MNIKLKRVLEKIIDKRDTKDNGGAGSGNWGHAGRKGKVGGSAPAHGTSEHLKERRAYGRRLRELAEAFGADNIVKKAVEKIEIQKEAGEIKNKTKKDVSQKEVKNKEYNFKTVKEIQDYLDKQDTAFDPDGMTNLKNITSTVEALDSFKDATGIELPVFTFNGKTNRGKWLAAFRYDDWHPKDYSIEFTKKYNKKGISEGFNNEKFYRDNIEDMERKIRYTQLQYDKILEKTKDLDYKDPLGFYIYTKDGKIWFSSQFSSGRARDMMRDYLNRLNKAVDQYKDTLLYKHYYNVGSKEENAEEQYKITMNHELGHCLEWNVKHIYEKKKGYFDIREFMNEMCDNLRKKFRDPEYCKQVSKYATTSFGEFLAENYALYKYRPDEVDKGIREDFIKMENYAKSYYKNK